MNEYDQFLAAKQKRAIRVGFEPENLSREGSQCTLFAWQDAVTRISLRAGRYALFCDCGLGKSGMQLLWADEVAKKTRMPVLILCPLAVAAQTVAEGVKFGVAVTHIREREELGKTGVFITNYDRIERFADEVNRIGGIVLDESSILKNMMGKTRAMLTDLFAKTRYKLCCTATPAPNDYTELGQHAEFLNVMSAMQMLATWFINDTSNTGTWRLKKHARDDFWRWVGSWAACISKPSDIGYSDEGYILPPLELHNHTIAVDEVEGAPEGELFRAASVSATNLHRESRYSLDARCEMAVKIATETDEPCIVWCELNDESAKLKSLFDEKLKDSGIEFVEIKGADSSASKERKIDTFTKGEARIIISKCDITGHGVNWQHCREQVYVGQSWSMEQQYQAIRRSYRFGQTMPVHIHFLTPSTLGDVRVRVREKFAAHEVMKEEMKLAAKEIMEPKKISKESDDIPVEKSDNWTVYNGDCVRVYQGLESESVGFSVFSPPFADLFCYSDRNADMGNCSGLAEFMEHFRFLIKELYRVTMPGRLCAAHCCDLLATKWKHGSIHLQDFTRVIEEAFCGDSDDFLTSLSSSLKNSTKKAFKANGWLLHSVVTIWKNPVVEMQRTKAHGLLYKTLKKDSSASRVGCPDYLLVFKKPGANPKLIANNPDDFSCDEWEKIAEPVWMDIDQGNVLNRKGSKESGDERHICPLQLDVIERALRLWSAPGDLVSSPFTGIGSEGYQAVKMGRKFVGAELKPSYFRDACLWIKQAESEQDLFALK